MRLLIAAAAGYTTYLLVGLFAGVAPSFRRSQRPQRAGGRLAGWLAEVGSPLTPTQFLLASASVGAAAWLVLGSLLGDPVAGFFPAAATTGVLAWSHQRRRRQRRRQTEEAWPDAIRHLLSYVRSGATIQLAVVSLAAEGPGPLQEAFVGWGERARLLGFPAALETVRGRLADPTSDRVIEVLLIAHEWGGGLVAEVLADLADEVTEDLRTARVIRAEGTTQRIESWVVGVAPWLLLLYLTGTQGPYRDFYQAGTGRVVVSLAGVWWAMGLTVLAVLKRQDTEPRVLGAAATDEVSL